MNTIQLECFVAVAEHLNFSRASEELKITQPAVSHQIRSLEEELGVVLFRRTSKSVTLTQEGLQFLPDAGLILKTAHSAKERLGHHENFMPFELGFHNHTEINMMPPVLKGLIKEFPLLRPSLRLLPFPAILGQIENKQIHAAFGIKEEQKKSSLYFRELCSAPVACVCSYDHPLAQYETLTRNRLSGSFVACSPRQITDSIFVIQNRQVVTLPPEQRYFADTFESALPLIKAGAGYTLYPDIVPAREPELCYIPVTDLPPLTFGVYYRYDDDHPILKRFLSLCRTILF